MNMLIETGFTTDRVEEGNPMNPAISTVLFDMGGGLVHLDGMPSLSKVMKECLTDEEINNVWVSCQSVTDHETGKIDCYEFANRVVTDLSLDISASAFLSHFRSWPERVSPETFEMLESLTE